MSTFQIGDAVAVNYPHWYRHGERGTVIAVNHRTIRVQIEGSPDDVVCGHPIFFLHA